jgi:hypothetical protein
LPPWPRRWMPIGMRSVSWRQAWPRRFCKPWHAGLSARLNVERRFRTRRSAPKSNCASASMRRLPGLPDAPRPVLGKWRGNSPAGFSPSASISVGTSLRGLLRLVVPNPAAAIRGPPPGVHGSLFFPRRDTGPPCEIAAARQRTLAGSPPGLR